MNCEVDGIERVLFPPIVLDATPRTLGSQADKNSGPGRGYWLEDQRRQHEERILEGRKQVAEMYGGTVVDAKPERPYWRDSDKINTKLATLTPQEKANYIMTGKTTDPITPSITTT